MLFIHMKSTEVQTKHQYTNTISNKKTNLCTYSLAMVTKICIQYNASVKTQKLGDSACCSARDLQANTKCTETCRLRVHHFANAFFFLFVNRTVVHIWVAIGAEFSHMCQEKVSSLV